MQNAGIRARIVAALLDVADCIPAKGYSWLPYWRDRNLTGQNHQIPSG